MGSRRASYLGGGFASNWTVRIQTKGTEVYCLNLRSFPNGPLGSPPAPARLAILGSVYRPQSNMQTIADRFLVGYPYDGEWHMPNVQVVFVYVDQLERKADAAPSPYQLAMREPKLRRQVQPKESRAAWAETAP
jgi:hypothetical protein